MIMEKVGGYDGHIWGWLRAPLMDVFLCSVWLVHVSSGSPYGAGHPLYAESVVDKQQRGGRPVT